MSDFVDDYVVFDTFFGEDSSPSGCGNGCVVAGGIIVFIISLIAFAIADWLWPAT